MKIPVAERIRRGLQEFTDVLESGAKIQDRLTCKKVSLDLKATPYGPEKVLETRKLLGVSQPVFALLLGVSVKTVQSWEQGFNPPKNVARRFMDEFRRDPAYWIERLNRAAAPKEAA